MDELGLNYGNDMINNTALWYYFYSQRMLEKEDRQNLKRFTNKTIKLTLASFIAGGIANRALTNLNIGNLEFMNLKPIFRIPIRLLIFFIFLNYGTLSKSKDDMKLVYGKLSKKYIPRYKMLRSICDPLVMNPRMLNEEGMNDEDREYMLSTYQKMKDALLAVKQSNDSY